MASAGLEVKEAGRALRVQTEAPHLVSMGSGRLSTAVTLHPLPEGRVVLGSDRNSDIVVVGTGVESIHCAIENSNGIVVLHPIHGNTLIDGVIAVSPIRLTQGCMLLIGRSNFMRYNNPAEAKQLKSVLPNSRISMAPINFCSLTENLEEYLERKPPVVPRKSPRNSYSDDEIGFQGKLTKFEMLARQSTRNCVSPKVFPAGSLTTNVPADQILGHSRTASLVSLTKCQNSPLRNLTNFDTSRSSTPHRSNSTGQISPVDNYRQRLDTSRTPSRSNTPNSEYHTSTPNSNQIQMYTATESFVKAYKPQYAENNNENHHMSQHSLLPKIHNNSNFDLMSKSLTCQVGSEFDKFGREFDMSQSLIVTKTTMTEFLHVDNKFGSNPNLCNRPPITGSTPVVNGARYVQHQNFGSNPNIKRNQVPSPAFNRNPKYSEHKKIQDRIKSPTPSVGSNCSLDELRERQADAEYKRKEAENKRKIVQEERMREQEIERQEKMRLEEILAMCAEYERQNTLEKPRQPNRIKTNGSLPRDKRPSYNSPFHSPKNTPENQSSQFSFELTNQNSSSLSSSTTSSVSSTASSSSTTTTTATSQPTNTNTLTKAFSNNFKSTQVNGNLPYNTQYATYASDHVTSINNSNRSTPTPSSIPSRDRDNGQVIMGYDYQNLLSPSQKLNVNQHHHHHHHHHQIDNNNLLNDAVINKTAIQFSTIQLNGTKIRQNNSNYNFAVQHTENIYQNGNNINNNNHINNIHSHNHSNYINNNNNNNNNGNINIYENVMSVTQRNNQNYPSQKRSNASACEIIENKLAISNDDLLEAIEQLSMLSKSKETPIACTTTATTAASSSGGGGGGSSNTPKKQYSDKSNAKTNELKADNNNCKKTAEDEDKKKYIAFLENEKLHILGNMDILKRSIADIEIQEEEISRELELEKALLSAEYESESLKLTSDETEKVSVQIRINNLEREMAEDTTTQAKLQADAKLRVDKAQKLCTHLEAELRNCNSEDKQQEVTDKLHVQQDALETERKTFEDLEFHHLEEEASKLATREELQRYLSELSNKIESRKTQINHLESQRNEAKVNAAKESRTLERQKLGHMRRLEEGRNRLRAIDDELHKLTRNVPDNIEEKRSSSREDFDRISRVTTDSPIVNNQGSLGRKTIESLREIERNRQLHLAKQGSQVISEERRRVEELKRRVQDEVRSQWEERKMNCASFNSVESGEESSSYSTGPTESGSGSSDGADGANEKMSPSKLSEFTSPSPGPSNNSYTLLQNDNMRDGRRISSMEGERLSTNSVGIVDGSDSRPLSETSSEIDSVGSLQTVKHREKPKLQRPLTRYLPIKSESLDLRHHIETAGHQLSLIHDVIIDTTTCSGYLSKMSKKFHHWNKRWFVFDRKKKTMSYYSDNSSKKARGLIYFQSIEEVYVDHMNTVRSPQPSLTFIIKTSTRSYHLMAPSPEAMRVWVDVVFTGAEGYHEFDHEV